MRVVVGEVEHAADVEEHGVDAVGERHEPAMVTSRADRDRLGLPGRARRTPAVAPMERLENLTNSLDDELVFWYGSRTSSCAPFTGAAPPRSVGRWRERRSPRGCSARWFVASRWTCDPELDVRYGDRGRVDPACVRRSTGSRPSSRSSRGRAINVGSVRRMVRRRRRRGCVVIRGCAKARRVARSRPGRVCELLPKVGAAWRDGEITGGAAKTIAAARVEGHDLKLRALEDRS